MMKYIRLFASSVLIVFCGFCNAQNKTELPIGNVKSETKGVTRYDGPNSITRNIIQDRKGNIWIASWEGIFRYDPHPVDGQEKSFTNITSKVSSARFFSLLEDRKGNFWFGTIGSGVFYYQPEGSKSLPTGQAGFQNFTTKDGLVNNEITCIYEDKAGNIWFGVNGGVSCYDAKSLPTGQAGFRNYMMNGDLMNEDRTGKTIPDFTRPPNEVNSIIEDKTGKFWFATRGNTFVYDARLNDGVGQGKTFTVLTHDGKPFTNVRTIIEDKKGNIWLSGNDGLWRYDGSTFTNFTQKFVGYIIEDKKGNIWTSSESISGQGWALSRYDGKSLSNKKPTVTEIVNKPSIFGILEDNKGNIWFGADGVYHYDANLNNEAGQTNGITDYKK